MTTSDKLREIAHKYGGAIITGYGQSSASGFTEMFTAEEQCLSDLTALISEGYVEKAKYDEAVRQRDELREALAEQKRIYFNLFEEEVRCMYCEAKINRGSAIILCKECAENTEA